MSNLLVEKLCDFWFVCLKSALNWETSRCFGGVGHHRDFAGFGSGYDPSFF